MIARFNLRASYGPWRRPLNVADSYGRASASGVTFDGRTPPSLRPRPSRPWQLAQGKVDPGNRVIPPSIVAVISPVVVEPCMKISLPRISSGVSSPADADVAKDTVTLTKRARRERTQPLP